MRKQGYLKKIHYYFMGAHMHVCYGVSTEAEEHLSSSTLQVLGIDQSSSGLTGRAFIQDSNLSQQPQLGMAFKSTLGNRTLFLKS